jgi:hypothetical protein
MVDRMKLFIWEGDGISGAYHDDGTLVVLAETVEQARELALSERAKQKAADARHHRAWESFHAGRRKTQPTYLTTPDPLAFDGDVEALKRKPDRILDIETPKVVAFNGGGYD